MRLVLDTNVFVSGVFFTGPPNRILRAWRDKVVHLVLTPAILDEYRRVGEILARDYEGVDLDPFLRLATVQSDIIDAPQLPEPVVTDPDDDKFLECALAGQAEFIVTGDKALLRVTGWRGISIVTPRAFVDRYLDPAATGS